MDKRLQSDLVIMAAALTGILAGSVTQSARRSEGAAAAEPHVIAAFLATTTFTRRAGGLAGLYPQQTAALAGTALVIGLALGFASSRVGRFLPRPG
jgi:hypothetical protein